MLSAYDRRLARRAAALSGLIALLSLLVVVTTDDGAPMPLRLGMVAALLPVAGAVGVFGALRIAESRGELRALAAIGVDPLRAGRGAILGGIAVAVLGPALAALPIADLHGLFPRPVSPRHWVAEGSGMRELTLGLHLGPGGALTLTGVEPAAAASYLSGPARGQGLFTVAALALTALVGPAWIGTPRPVWARLGAATLALFVAIVAFQGVAAERLPPLSLLGAPILLFLDGARARYLARRS